MFLRYLPKQLTVHVFTLSTKTANRANFKIFSNFGGSGEIRTHDTVSRMPLFESGAFNHSATLPYFLKLNYYKSFR